MFRPITKHFLWKCFCTQRTIIQKNTDFTQRCGTECTLKNIHCTLYYTPTVSLRLFCSHSHPMSVLSLRFHVDRMLILTCFWTEPKCTGSPQSLLSFNISVCNVRGRSMSDLQCCQVSAQSLELLKHGRDFVCCFLLLLQ